MQTRFQKAWKKYCIVIPSVLIIFAFGAIVYLKLPTKAVGYANGVHTSIAANYTYGEIFGNLSVSVPIFLRTIVKKIAPWIAEMLGFLLSGLSLPVFKPIIILFGIIAFIALYSNNDKQQIVINKNQRILFFSIHFLTCFAIVINMFHACTPHGSEYIGGVQGRYFLTTLPLFMIACYIPKLEIKKDMTKVLLGSAAFLNLAVILNIICATFSSF